MLTRTTLWSCFLFLLVMPKGLLSQRAPASSTSPWLVPSYLQREQDFAVAHGTHTSIDPEHTYTLAELFDLAEQHNPDTRVAWEQARAQAAYLGIAKAELFPAVASLLMVHTHRDGDLFNSTFVRQTISDIEPALEVNYLIFDFGGRSARIQEARERLLNSNLAFNQVMLDVLFETEHRYYTLLNNLGQRDADQVNLKNANTVQNAVDARLAVGLATLPDALEARAAARQAAFVLQAAIGQVDIARGDLLSLLGAFPLDDLKVQSLADLQLPQGLTIEPKTAVEDALRERPELGIDIANRDQARAEVREARSAFLPTLDFMGTAGEFRAHGQQDQLPRQYYGPLGVWNATINLRWDLFEGGRRVSELARAHADEQQAQASIEQTRDRVEEQVYAAYVGLRTAFSEREAAIALVLASQASYDAALKSYQLGLRSTVDVVTAQRLLAQSLSTDVTSRTDLLIQLANLAYRTGDLLDVARKAHP